MSEELARIETIKESPPDIFDACDLGLIDIIENLCSKQTIKLDEINSVCYITNYSKQYKYCKPLQLVLFFECVHVGWIYSTNACM